jgi:hypothetical protein
MLDKVKGLFGSKDAMVEQDKESVLMQENRFLRERADHWCAVATDLRVRMNTMRARIAENRGELGMRSNQLLAVLESICKEPEESTQSVIKPATIVPKTTE